MKKKIISFIVILLVSSFYTVFAANTFLVIVQHNGLDIVSSISKNIENNVLDTLFDSGHIVSNDPIIINDDDKSQTQKSFRNAVLGGMDYYIELTINFDLTDSKNPDGLLLSNIQDVVYSIKSVLSGDLLVQSESIKTSSVKNDSYALNRYAALIGSNINSDIINLKKQKKL